MNVIFDVNHPADFHTFKNTARVLEKQGHSVLFTVSKKDVSLDLVNRANVEYVHLGSYGKTLPSKVTSLPLLTKRLIDVAKRFRPDIIVGWGSVRGAFASKLLKSHTYYVDINENDYAIQLYLLYHPFIDYILTPKCYSKNLGQKQVRYKGYHELAYLHPRYFRPNPEVLRKLGHSKHDKIVTIRLVSWDAWHDYGKKGVKDEIEALIKELSELATILISCEGTCPESVKRFEINEKLAPDEFHSLLYYSSLYIGEGATTAAESAILGTPAIYINPIELGYIKELENKYGLVHSFHPNFAQKAFKLATNLLTERNLKAVSMRKARRVLKDSIDVTRFYVRFLTNIEGNSP